MVPDGSDFPTSRAGDNDGVDSELVSAQCSAPNTEEMTGEQNYVGL